MGGKAALLLVLGFSMIFLVFGQNFLGISNRSIENVSRYYNEEQAYNIASAGANMAANAIFMDKYWDAGFSNLTFGGGTINVYVSNPLATTGGKVWICHRPPGNPAAQKSLFLPSTAAAAHMAHGDSYGQCGAEVVDNTIATIVSEGTFNNVTKTIIVQLRPSNFAKFGNYYSSISAMPATGDTFHGPFHVNGTLSTYGSPVFLGKVSSRLSLSTSGTGLPVFNAGYQPGVDIPLEFDTTGLRTRASSSVFRGTNSPPKGIDVKLYFNNNGTVTYQTKLEGASSWSANTTVSLSSFAPNGVIYVEKGNIYTKGTVNGNVTIVATKAGRTGFGNVYFEDDIRYNTNPRTNPNSTDMLGIIAEENIRIQDNSTTRGKNIYTEASMFAMNGNIGPDDGLISQNFLGNWYILGGVIAKTTRATATYSGSTPVKGLKFNHRFDERFYTVTPPAFPNTKNYEVVSWYE
ncbi:MAG: hypothetical protein N2321_01665 [Melioribacteraceae bacterium]|nr:hypothetical protein [Melioribacteraceae bacterium]